jgi:hypothetical protein
MKQETSTLSRAQEEVETKTGSRNKNRGLHKNRGGRKRATWPFGTQRFEEGNVYPPSKEGGGAFQRKQTMSERDCSNTPG